jgi:ribose transport system permease protein
MKESAWYAKYIPRKTDSRKKLTTLVLTLLLVLIAAVISGESFFSAANFRNLMFQNAILGVVVLGQLFVILSGGIDLSIGSLTGLSTILIVGFQDLGFGPALILTILLVSAAGFVNGALVTLRNLPPFVVTLGSMLFIFSLSQVISGGSALYRGFGGGELTPPLAGFNSATLFGIPAPAWVWGTSLLLAYVLMKTSFGRYLFAYGGSRKTALFSGIPTKLVGISVFMLSGLFAALGGFLAVARVSEGSPGAGDAYLMDSIAAVVIGGASLSGGMGSVLGTFLGVLIIGVLNNILNLIGVSPMLKPAVKGIIILIAVYINSRDYKS